MNDGGPVREAAVRVLPASPRSAAGCRTGGEKAFGFLVGKVMRKLKGKANPQTVNSILRELPPRQETPPRGGPDTHP